MGPVVYGLLLFNSLNIPVPNPPLKQKNPASYDRQTKTRLGVPDHGGTAGGAGAVPGVVRAGVLDGCKMRGRIREQAIQCDLLALRLGFIQHQRASSGKRCDPMVRRAWLAIRSD